jgi:hypothetical protein
MQSNSKLNKFEKSAFKDMKKFLPNVQFAQMGKTTLAFAYVGELVEFATAICADNEKKNRPKVGKYWALTRYESGQTVKMPNYQFANMLNNQESLSLWA